VQQVEKNVASEARSVDQSELRERRALPFELAGHRLRQPRESERKCRQAEEGMRDAAMPGENEQIVAGDDVANNVRIRKNRPKRCGCGDDAGCCHARPVLGGLWQQQEILAAEQCLPQQRARNPVRDRVHPGQRTASSGEVFAITRPTRLACTPCRSSEASAAPAESAAIATSSPPDVCGSNSRS